MTVQPYTSIEFPALLIDGATADADGTIWTWTSLAGWWEQAAVRVEESEVSPLGTTVTVAREIGRALTLGGLATNRTVGRKLGAAGWYKAAERLEGAVDFLTSPGLMLVNDTLRNLQAYVRRAGPVLSRGQGPFATYEFQVPLLMPDPRRYSQTLTTDTSLALTGSTTGISGSVIAGGNRQTGPVVTIDGPAVNPYIRNDTLSGAPYVRWIGALGGGDTLVIDMEAATVTLNGLNDRGNLDVARWWQLAPGMNTITYHRSSGSGSSTAQLEYRDAYG